MDSEHSLISVQTQYLLGVRERISMQIIEENDGILTADLHEKMYQIQAYRGDYERQNNMIRPHLLLQDKGLIKASSKGGRAKYWHLTELGKQIQTGTGCTAKTSTNYTSLQNDMEGNVLPTGAEMQVAVFWLYDLICRKLSNGQRTVVLEQLPETVRTRITTRTEVIA